MSELWGDMTAEEFAGLVEDVRAHGVRVPVTKLDGQVLEGWHRYLATLEVGVTCPFKDYAGDDPGGFVISHNAMRRNLTPAERAERVLLVREWSSTSGRRAKSIGDKLGAEAKARTNAELAAEAGVGTTTIKRAKRKIREERGEVEPAKPPAMTRMEKALAENESLKDQVNTLQDELDRHDQPPPEPSNLEAETVTLRKRVNALIADLDKERRMHTVTRERLRRCMEARSAAEE